MSGERIRIEGDPGDLERLRCAILDQLGDEIDVQPVAAAVPGELGEPVLAGLVVTLTPAVAIRTLGALVERVMTHRERLELLRIYRESGNQRVSMEDLSAEDPAP